MKKALSILLSFIMAITTMQSFVFSTLAYDEPTFEGPNDSEHSYLDVHTNGEDYNLYYRGLSNDSVELDGISYDLEQNTLTLNNYNRQDTLIEMSEMGSDFKINVVGENHINAIAAFADKYMNSVTIEGSGSLAVNEGRDYYSFVSDAPVYIDANDTRSILKIADTVKFSVYANDDESSIKVNNSSVEDSVVCNKAEQYLAYSESSITSPVYTRAYETQDNNFYAIKDSELYTTYIYDEFSEQLVYVEFELINRNIDGKDVTFAKQVMDDMGNPISVSEDNIIRADIVTACQLLFDSEKALFTKENDETEYAITEYTTSENEGVTYWDIYKVMRDDELGSYFYPVEIKLTEEPTGYNALEETIVSCYKYILGDFSNFDVEVTDTEYTFTAMIKDSDRVFGDGDTIYIKKGKSALLSFDVVDSKGNGYVTSWYSIDMADAGFVIADEPVIENDITYASIQNNAEIGTSGTLIINAYSAEKFNSQDSDWITTPADATFSLNIESIDPFSCNHNLRLVMGEISTCTKGGHNIYVCEICGAEKREELEPLGHDMVKVADAVNATCFSVGNTAGYKCSRCDYEVRQEEIPMIAHTSITTITRATTSAAGKIVNTCTVCGKTVSTSVIPKASSIKLSTTLYTYDGKIKTPSVTVKDSKGKTLVKNTDYKVSYVSGRKNVGEYAVKITFKGNYSGTETLYFTIKPKSTSISSLTAGSKKFTVKWNKQSTQTTGYQIQYSTSSKFTNSKTVTVSNNSTTSKTISKLSAKKKYCVRVRAYKTVKINGKATKIYSSWSKAKYVTTKE